MELEIKRLNKWRAVEYDRHPSEKKMRNDLLNMKVLHSDFVLLSCPVPARDTTLFKVSGNDKELLVGVAMINSVPPRIFKDRKDSAECAEIFFDPYHDHTGWFQFVFPTDVKAETHSFLPYPQAHSSAFRHLELKKNKCHTETFTFYSGWLCRWVFAWFRTEDVFRNGDLCGFNICKSRSDIWESSSWNYCSGNGYQDATGFGHLYAKPPAVIEVISAEKNENILTLKGKTALRELKMAAVLPSGDAMESPVEITGDEWKTELNNDNLPAGRYFFKPAVGNGAVEPQSFCVDVPDSAKKKFTVSLTYDPPMSVIPNYYTPERLDYEMKNISEMGINRIHWIDYSDYDSFWASKLWNKYYRNTVKHCGDFLACAVKQAHKNGLDIFADLKVYDLGFNMFFLDKKLKGNSVKDIEGIDIVVIPEIANNQDCTLRLNKEWVIPRSFPVTKIRIYSLNPITNLKISDFVLKTSNDNKTYSRYNGRKVLKQGTIRRQNYLWTPAGKVKEDGFTKNWYVEFSGLNVKSLFLSIETKKKEFSYLHQAFMLVSAEDGSGREVPFTIATTGHRDFREKGYFFWKEWPGWVNSTEPVLQRREWKANEFCVTFQEMPNMPTLLEPSSKGARDIWLGRVKMLLDKDVDGVSIRTLCHHNGVMSYLKYAFAESVVTEFKNRFGRSPGANPDDYEKIRRIRGEFFTQFLRDAKGLTSKRGKKLAIQYEYGMEVPPQYDTRMQIHWDYETWINEGIVDEIELKWWTCESAFIHEKILPLARKKGIPVHVISRCLESGLEFRAMETIEKIFNNARNAGFSGYNFYETDDLMLLNPAGVSMTKGVAVPAIRKAVKSL